MIKIQVLMSTYNGERYLREQLNSILQQKVSNISILIRDDGSNDNTLSIIEEYSKKYNNISFYSGKNIGVVNSFFDLIKKCEDANYYCLADQDDVWECDKIGKAVEYLERTSKNVPQLYCSATKVVDEKLNIIKTEEQCIKESFGNALIQNICCGCTTVFNDSLRKIMKFPNNDSVIMHDWWIYLIASAFGKVKYDKNAYIMYRQHDGNSWGLKLSKYEIIKYRVGQLFKKRGYIYRQLNSFKDLYYSDLEKSKSELLDLVLESKHSIIGRIKLILNRAIYRNSRNDDFVYRCIVLVGKL